MKLRNIAVAGLAATALILSACGDEGEVTEGSGGGGGGDDDGGKPKIALVSKGFQHQFWQAVKDGAEQAAEEFDAEITFEGPESESEVAQQIDMLQSALDRNPDALGFAALDSEAAAPLMDEAANRDIPVVAFDSGVDSDVPLTTAATDNKAAAAEAAERMVDLIGDEGKIAMVVHDQTSVTGKDRRDGFRDYIEENAPDVEIVDIQYGGGDQLKSTDITRAIIQANPDIKGIFGANEGSAIGVINGVKEAGKEGDVVVIGYDSGKAQIDAINNGTMTGAITQDPIDIGYQTVKAAVEALDGEELPKTIDTKYYWYDQSNIDDEDIQAVLYE